MHLMRRQRFWTLWTLSLIITLTGLYNLVLAWDHLRHAGYYRDLGASYPPLLRAVTALAWGVLLAAWGIGLARRRSWARRGLVVLLSNYGGFGVLWLIVYARSDFGRGRIAFQAAVTALLIVLAAWIMRWRRVRAAFAAPHSGDILYDTQRSQD